jgi:hypothetical protein
MASRTYRDGDLEPWIKKDINFYEERLNEARRVRADRPSDLLFLRMEIDGKTKDYATLAESEVPIGIFKDAQLAVGWSALRARATQAARAYRELSEEAYDEGEATQ